MFAYSSNPLKIPTALVQAFFDNLQQIRQQRGKSVKQVSRQGKQSPPFLYISSDPLFPNQIRYRKAGETGEKADRKSRTQNSRRAFSGISVKIMCKCFSRVSKSQSHRAEMYNGGEKTERGFVKSCVFFGGLSLSWIATVRE